jgi:uncharacterized membrane protein
VASLETDGEELEERAFDYARTVALSDGVFAIALTLLVLTLTTPVLFPGHEHELGHRLLDQIGSFESYALSFAVIALLWVRHHGFFRALARIDGRTTLLNLTYLGIVAFLPYPTRILGRFGHEPVAVVLYATTMLAVTLVAVLMRAHALRHGLVSGASRRRLAAEQTLWPLVPGVFLVSIPLAFVSTQAALLSWSLLFLTRPLRGRVTR